MRVMYDAVNPANIPQGAQMVAGYVDGAYAWTAADWERFTAATKVRIAVHYSTNDGMVGDVENGDMTPVTAYQWVQMRRAAGVNPSLYGSQSTLAAVREVFQGYACPLPPLWVATRGGAEQLIPGFVANQWYSNALVDMSVVGPYWPGVDTRAVEDESMIMVRGSDQAAVYLLVSGRLVHVDNPQDEQALNAVGVPTVVVSDTTLANLEAASPALPAAGGLTGDVTVSGSLKLA